MINPSKVIISRAPPFRLTQLILWGQTHKRIAKPTACICWRSCVGHCTLGVLLSHGKAIHYYESNITHVILIVPLMWDN